MALGCASEECRGRGQVECPQTGHEWVFVNAERCGHRSSSYSVSFCICLNLFTIDIGRKGGERKEKQERTSLYQFCSPKKSGPLPDHPHTVGDRVPPQGPTSLTPSPPMQRRGESVAQGESHPGSVPALLLLSGRVGSLSSAQGHVDIYSIIIRP